jgi:PTS hybrid protein
VSRVGLVVVSHSRDLAAGVVELARQMAGPEVPLVPVGGGPEGSLGTDATAVAEAIRTAQAGAGVVVLVDLGSAGLAARTALELLGDAAGPVHLSPGPLVEGAVLAAIEASAGGDLQAVAAVALAASDLDKGVAP